jgi:hypothetical protein
MTDWTPEFGEDWKNNRGPALYPIGTPMRKISGPEWDSIVVGYYSSSYTPEGLCLECIAKGARGQVHVEPAKRMELRHD